MVELSQATAPDSPLILLVDDDADTREMYGLWLSSSGFAVDQARDANEALTKVKSAMPDVVVTDVTLPGIDGFALCREIRRDDRTARIPVIAVTGYSSPRRVQEAEHAVGFQNLGTLS
jgi:two-component system phosphate regulon response regulator PhoB